MNAKKHCAGRRVITIIRCLCYIVRFLTYFKFSLLINEDRDIIRLIYLYWYHYTNLLIWPFQFYNLNEFQCAHLIRNIKLLIETWNHALSWNMTNSLVKNVIASFDPNETMATRKSVLEQRFKKHRLYNISYRIYLHVTFTVTKCMV